ncbi:uncharacterized protein LOC134191289 [Corticium candelabrum]|uniref:uncharacterized protein LOC134191289 n=1 Tax=Corticium candelabrum TaxID=121492 RepID=UPI002E25FAAF|nr:uncharacterized protein LOC134191289 [Corticium candelabrum]
MDPLPQYRLSMDQEADSKVQGGQLVKVAKEISASWQELAAYLDPDLFSPVATSVIRHQDLSDPQKQARRMLGKWVDNHAERATRRKLILALCEMGNRAQAHNVFTEALVTFVEKGGKYCVVSLIGARVVNYKNWLECGTC